MFEGPLVDFFGRPIGVAVVVITVPVALVEPLLVLTLELVVEEDAFNACAARLQALCVSFVGAIDLDVVFQLSLAFYAVVKGLAVPLVAVSMALEKVPAFLRERDRLLAVAGQANGLHEALLAKVAKVT
jgi:hypothetical protein